MQPKCLLKGGSSIHIVTAGKVVSADSLICLPALRFRLQDLAVEANGLFTFSAIRELLGAPEGSVDILPTALDQRAKSGNQAEENYARL